MISEESILFYTTWYLPPTHALLASSGCHHLRMLPPLGFNRTLQKNQKNLRESRSLRQVQDKGPGSHCAGSLSAAPHSFDRSPQWQSVPVARATGSLPQSSSSQRCWRPSCLGAYHPVRPRIASGHPGGTGMENMLLGQSATVLKKKNSA